MSYVELCFKYFMKHGKYEAIKSFLDIWKDNVFIGFSWNRFYAAVFLPINKEHFLLQFGEWNFSTRILFLDAIWNWCELQRVKVSGTTFIFYHALFPKFTRTNHMILNCERHWYAMIYVTSKFIYALFKYFFLFWNAFFYRC